MSDQNSILSDQDGVAFYVLSGGKKIITSPEYWMLLVQIIFDHNLE